MIRVVKKKSYSKRKAEDYILKRRLKFAFSKFARIVQVILGIILVAILVWVIKFDGYTKISNYTYNKATQFFISFGLKIESVEIGGNKTVPTDIILEKIFWSLGDVHSKSIILLDLEKLRNDLTSIGWIESVDIKKKLPDKLIITVIERTPKLLWQNSGKVWLADKYGNLLTQKVEKKYIYLPLVIGKEPLKDIPEFYNIINSSKRLAPMVAGATKIGGRRWDIMLDNKIKIKLPEENAAEAWDKLEEVEKKNLLFSKRINYIDMRIEDQLITGLEKEQKDEAIEINKQPNPAKTENAKKSQ